MVDLFPDAEQEAIINAVRDVLRTRLPVERMRARRAGSIATDLALWPELGTLGWFALGLPEAGGGAGFGVAEEALLCTELGRHLVSPSALATLIACHMLHLADHPSLPAVIAGEQTVCFGNTLPGRHALSAPDIEVQLIDGVGASLVVLCHDQHFMVFEATAISQRRPVASLDPTIVLERAMLNLQAPVVSVKTSHELALRASVMLAALLTGIARQTRDMAVDYAMQRQQFGKPIGSFQAIKHHCANMALHAEACGSLVSLAALNLTGHSAEAAYQASAAHLIAARAAHHNAALNIQVHGGIGFTEDHDAHLFLKRSHVLASLCGGLPRQEVMIATAAVA